MNSTDKSLNPYDANFGLGGQQSSMEVCPGSRCHVIGTPSLKNYQIENALRLNSPSNIKLDEVIVNCGKLVGLGIREKGDKGNYTQIIPYDTFIKASNNFNNLPGNVKCIYKDLLQKYSEGDNKNLFAVSTLFSILAYSDVPKEGTEPSEESTDPSKRFAAKIVHDQDAVLKLQEALDNGERFFLTQQNFQQNYLSICSAVSAFTALTDSFYKNIFVLTKAIEFELNKIDIDSIEDSVKNKKAYNTINRFARTVKEEVTKRINQCRNAIGNVDSLLEDEKSFSTCQNELVKAFERLSAVKNPSSPVLISKKLVHNFPLACIFTSILNFLAKIFTLGIYTGSAKISERFAEIEQFQNSLINTNEETIKLSELNIADWNRISGFGTSVESRSLVITDHAIAIKACIDDDGGKYLEIHDPLKNEVSKVYVE